MDYDAYDAVLHHIFKQTQGDAWLKPQADNIASGVCIRVQPGLFRVFPYDNPTLAPFHDAVAALNPEAAVKLRTASVHAALSSVKEDQDHFFIDEDTRIQVLENVEDLANAEKDQRAAFIRSERVLVVWEDRVEDIIPAVNDLEQRLVRLVWRERNANASISGDRSPGSATGSGLPPTSANNSVTRLPGGNTLPRLPFSSPSLRSFNPTYGNIPPAEIEAKFRMNESKENEAFTDVEKASTVNTEGRLIVKRNRPTRILANFYIGFAAALSLFFVGNGVNVIIREFTLDNDPMRFLLLVTAPLIFAVALFFSMSIVNSVSFTLGPTAHYHENSKYYSAVPPPPIKMEKLPHITIQMPVYKESVEKTIQPSIESIKEAMVTYARQGGTSSIFICDDGLQLCEEAEREARLNLYSQHDVGWVARPKHSNEAGGFKRRGRFKKASNMNYGLSLSIRMEEILRDMQATEKANPGYYDEEGVPLEELALRKAVDETNGEAWASNARSLRIGEIILLVDSDTQVPDDCFRDAARELYECPEVAIIQHESDVLQVAHHWFENGMAYFTRRINHSIGAATANGEVAPFVGHNAFLRWSAVQDAAFLDPGDANRRKFWSESHVSEDFDMSLRLQVKGYVIRWANYSNGGFKEGVSLTCDDELNRWMKYAYGCSELLFNPFRKWYKGPVTKEIHRFVWSTVPLHYKISVMAYMFSYYGIAAAFTLTLLNYLLLGFAVPVDGYYMRSWEMWLAITVVFVGAGNLGIIMLDYRVYNKGLLPSFWYNLKWVPFFFFFFGGLSLHLTAAILAHMFSVNISWSSTVKEVEVSNFFKEIPRILKRFKWAFAVCLTAVVGMVLLSGVLPVVPVGWRITGGSWAVIFPFAVQLGCHILYPIVLNPWLMIFSY
ncbi:hypothetical protein M422DRAFT_174596 [Sphaerobolus stellatus SS14]|uniref:Glycosyltransferase 2-like domain-containing protein n=1 Tax=Sphaerobolus stellatus (strain SS14) TaxID=990650 RepID=A0A0C9VEZ9_SPHS4|nr:hypothetical protein M422DRAFT_174596 [Sphaerobolus stellatus SS14]